MKLTPRERFLAKVCPEPNGGCWLWEGGMCRWLRLVRFERKVHLAHRWHESFRGRDCPGLVICHKCDVRACVNPEHLFLGTHGDNVRDRVKKAGVRTVRTYHAKLTVENVRKIKTMLSEDRCM